MEWTVCHRPLFVRLVEEGICNACSKKQHCTYQQGLEGVTSIVYKTGNNIDDSLITMTKAKENVKEEIETKLSEFNGIKWFILLEVTTCKLNREGEENRITALFRGETKTLLNEYGIGEQCNKRIDLTR